MSHMHDPKACLMVMPLLDFVNHDHNPNVVALPYHDKVSDVSYVILNAIKDIVPGEQLLMSYGDIANSQLI